MKFLRSSFPAFVLSVSALLSGCFSVHPIPPTPAKEPVYHKVVTSDFEGKRIAEFIAEGEVINSDEGYRFWAVQRRIFHPAAIELHYPLGRTVTAQAPNVIVTPTCKPEWLVRLDGGRTATDGKSAQTLDSCPDGVSN